MNITMQRLKELRKNNKYTQSDIANYLGITQGAYGHYEIGRTNIPIEVISKLSKLYNVTSAYLLGESNIPKTIIEEIKPKKNKYDELLERGLKAIRVKILGEVPAGIPVEAIEDYIDEEEVVVSVGENEKEYFGLKVKGDSMSPKIEIEDYAICRKQSTVDSGDIAVVLINGNEATLKYVKRETTGIVLIPNNPSYETKFFTNREIEELPVQILGKVIEIRRKL